MCVCGRRGGGGEIGVKSEYWKRSGRMLFIDRNSEKNREREGERGGGGEGDRS